MLEWIPLAIGGKPASDILQDHYITAGGCTDGAGNAILLAPAYVGEAPCYTPDGQPYYTPDGDPC